MVAGPWVVATSETMSAISLQLGALAVGLFCSGPCLVKGSSSVPTALGGAWQGDGLSFVLDVEHFQANVDPEKPFDWRPFTVIDVAGSMVVFDIGHARYFALLKPDGSVGLSKAGSGDQFNLRHPDPELVPLTVRGHR